MKAKVIITLAALLLLSSVATATDTRVRTMGDNNMILLDEANITIFPSRLNDFPKLAIGEFGGNDFYELGIHWQFGSDNPWHLGTYISTLNIGVPTDYYNGAGFGHFTGSAQNSDKRVDLYYAREWGPGSWKYFGFHFGYVRASYEAAVTGASPSDYKENIYYYDFDWGFTNAAKDIDVSLHLGKGGWTDEVAGLSSVEETAPDGFWDFGLKGRWFTTVIWHAEFAHGVRGEKDHVTGDGDPATLDDLITKDTRTIFDIGCGYNWTPATNVLVVGDVGLAIDKIKREYTASANYPTGVGSSTYKDDRTYFPYWSIGFDADVFKWMDIRMGASSDWILRKREFGPDVVTVNTEVKEKMAENLTYLGFGFHWGRLHVDTETDPDLFLRGFDFITGKGTGTDMNARISVVYELM